MYTTVTKSDFINTFKESSTYNSFSYEALCILFEYLESIEDDTDKQIEFDYVAIACEYNEAHYQTIADDYSIDLSDCDESEWLEEVKEYLSEHSLIVGVVNTDCIVYAEF